MKFYFIEFAHKESGKVIYKFGYTKEIDVLKRFHQDTFDSNRLWIEFNKRVLFSAYGTFEQVSTLETKLLELYPKNYILENYLSKPFGYFNGLSGITETFITDEQTKNKICTFLYNIKNEKNQLLFEC